MKNPALVALVISVAAWVVSFPAIQDLTNSWAFHTIDGIMSFQTDESGRPDEIAMQHSRAGARADFKEEITKLQIGATWCVSGFAAFQLAAAAMRLLRPAVLSSRTTWSTVTLMALAVANGSICAALLAAIYL